MKQRLIIVLVCSLLAINVSAQKKPVQQVAKAYPVAKVWAGHQVGFDIYTTEQFQYVCYYDSARNMIIAQRTLNSDHWKTTILPTVLGWDSHNYVTMAIDKNGFIHVSGNMHNVPMIYFISKTPENIDEFDKLPMTGKKEDRATYPVFFKDQQGDLYFQYRNGGSGDGISFWNKYDSKAKQWISVFDTPLFDGESESNAYMTEPKLGPDGYFYIVWMWRLTPTANTNHNLSCIRSKDLIHWENLQGTPLSIPIKWRDNIPVVDPVGPWNGLINMSFKISFNIKGVPYISYHKYDNNGVSQLYVARFEKSASAKGNWKIYQLSDWKDFTWPLNLNGSLNNSTGITSVKPSGKNEFAVTYYHEKHGNGTWIVDESTMKIKKQLPAEDNNKLSVLPALTLQNDMVVHRKTDNTGRFVMQWLTLPANQDKPRTGTLPAPTDLVVYEIDKN